MSFPNDITREFIAANSALYITNMSSIIAYNNVADQSQEAGVRKIGLILKIIVTVMIMIIGTLGNLVIVVTVVKERNLHRPPFYYLVSMCVSDMIRAVLCLPFVMASLIHDSGWTHGESACKMLGFAGTVLIVASAAALLSISLDRYISVVCARLYRRRSYSWLYAVNVVLLWLLSLAVSFPPVFSLGSYQYIPEESHCALRHQEYTNNDTFGFLLGFSVILVGTMLFYVRIFIFLRKHRRMRPLDLLPVRSSNWTFFGPGNGMIPLNVRNAAPMAPAQVPTVTQHLSQVYGVYMNVRTRKNEHLTRLFFIITVMYDCLWVLHTVQSFVTTFKGREAFSVTLRSISAWLTYVQVCNCPIIFFCCCAKFRRTFLTNVVHLNTRNDGRDEADESI